MPSPSVSPLLVVQLPPNLALQFSETKSLKGNKIHNVEYRKLLKTVYIKIGAASSYFI